MFNYLYRADLCNSVQASLSIIENGATAEILPTYGSISLDGGVGLSVFYYPIYSPSVDYTIIRYVVILV